MTQDRRTTVTFLELHSPPTRQVPPPALPVAILRVRRAPVHYYRYLYGRVGAEYHWVDRDRMTDEELAAILDDEAVEIYVLLVEGAPAGYGELDLRRPGFADIAYFGLMADYLGRGLGRYFFDQLLSVAWRPGVDKVTINTCTLDHPAALPLYQKFGFEPVAQIERVIKGA